MKKYVVNNKVLRQVKISSPGRLCLFGEHSDWVGLYGTLNSSIGTTKALAIPLADYKKTARVLTPVEEKVKSEKYDPPGFTLIREDPNDTDHIIVEYSVVFDEDILTKECSKSNYLNVYIAGTLLEIMKRYTREKGKFITDVLQDTTVIMNANKLPIKKGLSSSASICCLVVKAIYEALGEEITEDEIADIAYHGERRTKSRCGRLDQICAYNTKYIYEMEFTNEEVTCNPLIFPRPGFFMVAVYFANLEKNTIDILDALNEPFPFCESLKGKVLLNFFTTKSLEYINKAKNAMRLKDPKLFGEIMTVYQEEFTDIMLQFSPLNICADRALNKLFAREEVVKNSCGAKGIGSHGDSLGLIICADEAQRATLLANLKELAGKEEGYKNLIALPMVL